MNHCNFIDCEFLPIKASESERIYEKFEGGDLLFPQEASLERIEQLKKSNVIDEQVLSWLLENDMLGNFASTFAEAKKKLAKNSYMVKDKSSELTYSEEENKRIDLEYESFWTSIQRGLRYRKCSHMS